MHDRQSPGRRARALVILFIAVGLMVAVATDLLLRSRTDTANRDDNPVIAGYDHTQKVTDDEFQDKDMQSDEDAAGEMWAKVHQPRSHDECPTDPPAFRRGCEGFVRSHRQMLLGGH